MIFALYGGIAALIISLFGAVWVQSNNLHHCQDTHETFIADVRVEKKAAKVEAREKEVEFKSKLGDANAKYQSNLTTLNNQLRDARKSGNRPIVPPASDGKSSSVPVGQVCFDWGELDRAQRDSETEIAGWVEEGAKTTTDLQCGIGWIKTLNLPEPPRDGIPH